MPSVSENGGHFSFIGQSGPLAVASLNFFSGSVTPCFFYRAERVWEVILQPGIHLH